MIKQMHINGDKCLDSKGKIALLTFGSDSIHLKGFEAAASRFEKEAIDSKVFSKVLRINQAKLSKLPNFDRIEKLADKELWGMGYFIWKPFIIDWALSTLSDEYTHLVYADSGCEILSNKVIVFNFGKIISKLENQPVLAHFTEIPEILTTKKTVLNILEDKIDEFRGNVEATVIYMKICPESKKFIREWLEFCIADNFVNIIPVLDSVSNQPHLPLHCYDQSVFSVLYKNAFKFFLVPVRPRTKLVNGSTIISRADKLGLSFNMVWPLRNRSEIPILKKRDSKIYLSILSSFLFRFLRILRRLKQKTDPRARKNPYLQLLIRYKERGFIAHK